MHRSSYWFSFCTISFGVSNRWLSSSLRPKRWRWEKPTDDKNGPELFVHWSQIPSWTLGGQSHYCLARKIIIKKSKMIPKTCPSKRRHVDANILLEKAEMSKSFSRNCLLHPTSGRPLLIGPRISVHPSVTFLVEHSKPSASTRRKSHVLSRKPKYCLQHSKPFAGRKSGLHDGFTNVTGLKKLLRVSQLVVWPLQHIHKLYSSS